MLLTDQEKKTIYEYCRFALYLGKENLLKEYYIPLMNQLAIPFDWSSLSTTAALSGQHQLLEKWILPEMASSNVEPDRQELAEEATYGNQRNLLEEFILPQMRALNIEPNWQGMAYKAASSGQRKILEEFILPQMKAINELPNWDSLARGAVRKGHLKLLEEFIYPEIKLANHTLNFDDLLQHEVRPEIRSCLLGMKYCGPCIAIVQVLTQNKMIPELTNNILCYAFPRLEGTINITQNLRGICNTNIENRENKPDGENQSGLNNLSLMG